MNVLQRYENSHWSLLTVTRRQKSDPPPTGVNNENDASDRITMFITYKCICAQSGRQVSNWGFECLQTTCGQGHHYYSFHDHVVLGDDLIDYIFII